MTPPVPPDCPMIETSTIDGDPILVSPNTLEGSKIELCAVAFFYWTREAQKLKRQSEREVSTGNLVLAVETHQQHIAAVQSAVGWAKWSGL